MFSANTARDWRVSRAGPMPFCWPSCSLLFCLQLSSLYLLFLYRLVVWGWGLRTDRRLGLIDNFPLPALHCQSFLIIIMIIIISWASVELDADLFNTSWDLLWTVVNTDEMYKIIINICLEICKKHVLPKKNQIKHQIPRDRRLWWEKNWNFERKYRGQQINNPPKIY